jgi:alpha-1,2-mannosyltransferase
MCTHFIVSTGAQQQAPLKSQDDSKTARNLIKVVSVGQFRPEKDHPLQLRSMYELRQLVPEEVWDHVSN